MTIRLMVFLEVSASCCCDILRGHTASIIRVTELVWVDAKVTGKISVSCVG